MGVGKIRSRLQRHDRKSLVASRINACKAVRPCVNLLGTKTNRDTVSPIIVQIRKRWDDEVITSMVVERAVWGMRSSHPLTLMVGRDM